MSQSSVQEAAVGISHPTNRAVVFDRASSTLEANLRMPLLLLSDDDADTFVYIESAPQQIDEATRNHWGSSLQAEALPIPHRVHSRKLLSTGSDVLKDLFQPRKQARARKRYGLTREMPPGVKYAIDLTPPSEGDEAVIFMTELSCPMGVRRWFELQSLWQLPAICVGGQDEVEWLPVPRVEVKREPIVISASDDNEKIKDLANSGDMKKNEPQRKSNPPPPPRILNWRGNLPTLRADSDQAPSDPAKQQHETENTSTQRDSEVSEALRRFPGLPLDYSPARHRTCLERVLHALEGLDPKLDTAPKLWTFFALAKLLQVATHPDIGDRILVWLYQGNNALFVEVNPELSYQIACGLQNRGLCQDSFAILVGEEALLVLDSLVRGIVPKHRTRTIHGRTREPLDDTEVQRVEYASKIFLDRVLDDFIKLAGTEMLWVERLVINNIRGSPNMPAHQPFVDELIDFCKGYVRSHICRSLNQRHARSSRFQFNLRTETKYPGLDFLDAQSRMPIFCRVLTSTFWQNLREATSLTDMYVPECLSLKELAPSLPNLQDQGKAIIQKVSPHSVDEAISYFLSGVNEYPHYESGPGIYFDFTYFQNDVMLYLKSLSSRMTNPPNTESSPTPLALGVQFEMIDTLVCLEEKEFRFLPLWAGGNDDGTGGVFEDQGVPLVKDGSGFSTAGPSVRLASDDNDYDTFSMDSFDTIHPDDAASTIERASHEATVSHATTASVASVSTSVLDFELVQPLRDTDIKSTTNDDCDVEMTSDADHGSDDFELLDDDNDDTIDMISDREDM
ncbi:hypothetical protein UA08_05200 [Talaromyces atroroseus]|uniref:Uncharacterized protein n=1 Tax=Talaromyces atroroseus TaxID=1441469 RepID=A0A225AY74_TALAT|nr:hypothetical protein UA08_05200 [Talaromyces atroroseus]OKL59415.1 hypothetical protein UA08_05200 [Talaromyces atroroseus]